MQEWKKEMLKKKAKKPLSPSWHSTSYTQLSRKQVNRPRSLFTHEIRFMVLFYNLILSFFIWNIRCFIWYIKR